LGKIKLFSDLRQVKKNGGGGEKSEQESGTGFREHDWKAGENAAGDKTEGVEGVHRQAGGAKAQRKRQSQSTRLVKRQKAERTPYLWGS